MKILQIQINDAIPLEKSTLALLKSMPEAVSFPQNTAKGMESGLKYVREIIDGKQERTTLDDFFHELRNNSHKNRYLSDHHLRQKRTKFHQRKRNR